MTEQNRGAPDGDDILTLARTVVEDWDMDTLIGYAVDRLSDHYVDDAESFWSDWDEMDMDNR